MCLTWQSGVVASVLFLGILGAKCIRTIPRERIFTIAALLPALAGILTSREIFEAARAQAVLATLGLWIIGIALQQQGIFQSISTRVLSSRCGSFFAPVWRSLSALPRATVALQPSFWKKIALCCLLVASVLLALSGWPPGTTFLCAGVLALILRTVPLTFCCDRFPWPLVLKIFSAVLFYSTMQSSGLSASLAQLAQGISPLLVLPLFFLLAQLASRAMPRLVAFSILLSCAVSLFAGSPPHMWIAGTVIACATAAPLFGKQARAGVFVLFVGSVIPACLFWPK